MIGGDGRARTCARPMCHEQALGLMTITTRMVIMMLTVVGLYLLICLLLEDVGVCEDVLDELARRLVDVLVQLRASVVPT
jgi:uncharacterized membrane protein (Fun14 family)